MDYKTKVGYGENAKEVIVKKPGFVIEVVAKVTAKNGRTSVASGSCASNERGFAHLEHDVRSTAHTRAKNRAISDMIGAGEVSAEEVNQAELRAENACTVNHDTLVGRESQSPKSKGKKYVRCGNCDFFKWKVEDITDAITPKLEPKIEEVKDVASGNK